MLACIYIEDQPKKGQVYFWLGIWIEYFQAHGKGSQQIIAFLWHI